MELNPSAIDFPPNQLHTPWKECSEMSISLNADIGEQAQSMNLFRWRLKPIGLTTSTPLKLTLLLENLAIPGSLSPLPSLSKNLKKLLEGPGAPVFELWSASSPIQWCGPLDPAPLHSGLEIIPWLAMGNEGDTPSDYTSLSDDTIRR